MELPEQYEIFRYQVQAVGMEALLQNVLVLIG